MTWDEITPANYFEGQNSAQLQPEDTHPPLVELTCFEGLSEQRIEELLKLTAHALCDNLKLNSNIFITYNEAKSGKVITGDGVVRK